VHGEKTEAEGKLKPLPRYDSDELRRIL